VLKNTNLHIVQRQVCGVGGGGGQEVQCGLVRCGQVGMSEVACDSPINIEAVCHWHGQAVGRKMHTRAPRTVMHNPLYCTHEASCCIPLVLSQNSQL
jgi:hypothetical protein